MRYLFTNNLGVVPMPCRRIIKGMFCRHKDQVSGEACSKNGLCRISGTDRYKVCVDCGKILAEYHKDY